MSPTQPEAIREQRFVFDEVAELYARTRPGYPTELIEDLIRAAELRPGASVLELGAGPAIASVPFSGRGFRLLCLEPGAQLAAIARHRLGGDANAQVAVTTFENWPEAAASFDLVFAAQSFHWLDPALRFSKSARVLKARGTLAIFANRPLPGTAPVDAAIQRAYAAHGPELRSRGIDTNTRENFLALFAGASDFGAAHCREYAWRAEYGVDHYVDLLCTHSDHRLLPPERLQPLLDAVRAAIDAHGGRVGVDYATVLVWAQRSL